MITAHSARHAELVSASILPLDQMERRQTKAHRKIGPMRIASLNQVDFPLAVPALELFLPRNGEAHVAKKFVMDEPMDTISPGKSGCGSRPMLPETSCQIGSNANVERSVMAARQNIDARGALIVHYDERDRKWMLKQVQHDGVC